jgi:hypothetical protein
VSAAPFVVPACPPPPKRCVQATRSPARASRTVVRPGRKSGGTTLVFHLARPAVLRVTIFRVFPSCRRIGAFSVRGDRGVNRVRFAGRFRGRRLPDGGYRLIVRARGAKGVASIPIVIASGRSSRAEIGRARRTVVCARPVVELLAAAPDPTATPSDSDDDGGLSGVLDRAVKKPVAGAAGAIAEGAKGLSARLGSVADDPRPDSFPRILVALLLLCFAAVGAIYLAVELARAAGVFRPRS